MDGDMGITTFKRDAALVAKARALAQTLPPQDRGTLEALVLSYEQTTFGDWKEVPEWESAALSGMVNSSSFDEGALAAAMAGDHPTLQQNFMRFCCKYIQAMASKSYFDDRNRSSVRIARKLAAALDPDDGLPFI